MKKVISQPHNYLLLELIKSSSNLSSQSLLKKKATNLSRVSLNKKSQARDYFLKR